jgi:hypothetical protein
MIGGVIDDTMEVKFDRPDSSIVADCGRDLYWTNGRIKLTEGEVYSLLQRDGKIVAPKCVCLDAKTTCKEAGQPQCDEMEYECNRAMNAGGQFCVQNRWGGQTCY